MTNIKHECAALAVLHEAIDIEFRHGEIFDAVEAIKFNGPFYTKEQVTALVEAAYMEGWRGREAYIDIDTHISTDWQSSQAKAGLEK